MKIVTQLFVISQHAEAGSKDVFGATSCRVEWELIPSDFVEAVYLDVYEYMSHLNDSVTEATLPQNIQDVIYYLYHTEVAIDSLLEQTTGRMKLLESLSSFQVSDDLPIILQLQHCHDDINIEEMFVKTCYNVNDGLSCLVELQIHKM